MTLDYRLEALAGRIEIEVLTLTPGRAITLGTGGDCVVTADGVLGLHGSLAHFDGELWALSASVAEPIFVDRLPAIMWTVVHSGAVLSIGGARLRVLESDLGVEVDLSELRHPSHRIRIPGYSGWMSVPT
jgi:hypothetical protein